jgi:TRAP-type C4-dicarboxylate transport system permease small subunit
MSSAVKKPGFVIFTAILNFFSAAAFLSIAAFMALAIAFGAAWGLDSYVQQQVSAYSPDPNMSYGLAFVFGISSGVTLLMGLYFLAIGIGLLKGKKFAWYLQVAMSTLGLLGLPLSFMTSVFVLPIGSVLNIVILIMFFRSNIRGYFGV